jgi:Flp pilus assembly protein TadG
VDGDVTEPAIPLSALPFWLTERFGYWPMKLSNESGLRSTLRKAWRASFRAGREEGSTLYEFAMVALLLSTLMVGIIYGGIMAYDRVVLANAVATGARSLAAGDGDPTVCTDFQTAITSAAYGLNTSQLKIVTPPEFTSNSGSGAGTSSCDVTTGTGPTGTACSSSAPCQILTSGELATVAASYPCDMSFPRLGINLCSITQGNTVVSNTGGSITVNCPYTYCFYSIASARIE